MAGSEDVIPAQDDGAANPAGGTEDYYDYGGSKGDMGPVGGEDNGVAPQGPGGKAIIIVLLLECLQH